MAVDLHRRLHSRTIVSRVVFQVLFQGLFQVLFLGPGLVLFQGPGEESSRGPQEAPSRPRMRPQEARVVKMSPAELA